MGTHSGREFKNLYTKDATRLADMWDEMMEHDVIGVDEVQFFPDLHLLIDLVNIHGKIVIAAGLDATFEVKEFGRINDLIPHADSVIKLTAVCTDCCSDDACYTRRNTTDTAIKVVGGYGMYSAVCRKCRWQ